MTRRGTNFYCDRCGVDVENGGVTVATTIVGVDPAHPTVLLPTRHLCIKERDGAPHGCTGNLLGPGSLADYTAYLEAHDG